MPDLKTRTLLKSIRESRGLSAAELAKRVDVTRQTIYAIEDGAFLPNTAVALRLAHVLGVRVEDLFTLDPDPESETFAAEVLTTKPRDLKDGQVVRLCRVNERWMAAPVSYLSAYLPAADGVISQKSGHRVTVKSAVDPHRARLLLAGCDPALSLITESLAPFGIEVISVPSSSRSSLRWLRQGFVHAAGSHLFDTATGEYNVPYIKHLFPEGDTRIVTFAVWEQGLVLARGNPKNIRSVADLASNRAILINRDKGSGSRDLLDKTLRKAGIAAKTIVGYDRVATGHLAAAYAVALGTADCCVAARSAARHFGLDFIPLAMERFDLSFSKASVDLPAAKAVLDLLNGASLRRKLETIAGYDTAHTGEVLA